MLLGSLKASWQSAAKFWPLLRLFTLRLADFQPRGRASPLMCERAATGINV